MAIPETELNAEIAGLARQLAYSAGLPVAGAQIVAERIVLLEEKLRQLEFRLNQVEHLPPHLQGAERR